MTITDPGLWIIAILGAASVAPILGKHSRLSSVVASILGIIYAGLMFENIGISGHFGGWPLGIAYSIEAWSPWIAVAISISSLVASLEGKDKGPVFHFLLGTLTAVLLASTVVSDLFTMYVVLELSSIIAYTLIAYDRSWKTSWISLKYLILSYFAFTIYLTAVGLIYAQTGTLGSDGLSHIKTPLLISMLVTPIFLKTGLFFTSMWLPMAHGMAPTEVSVILSGGFVKMGAALIFRIWNHLPSSATSGIITFGIISIILGGVGAIVQKDVKRILAYHTMSQMGIVVASGPIAGAVYALAHAIFKSLLFVSAGRQITCTGHRNIDIIRRDGTPLLRWTITAIGALSMMGMPLTLGAVAKTLVKQTNPYTLYWLWLGGILTTASMLKLLTIPIKRYRKTVIRAAEVILASLLIILGTANIKLDILFVAQLLAGLLLFHLAGRFGKHLHRGLIKLEKLDNALVEFLAVLLGYGLWIHLLI